MFCVTEKSFKFCQWNPLTKLPFYFFVEEQALHAFFDNGFSYKFLLRLPTRQDGVLNRDKVYWIALFCFAEKLEPDIFLGQSTEKLSFDQLHNGSSGTTFLEEFWS